MGILRERIGLARLGPCWVAWLWVAVLGCGDSGLDVTGNTERVVGETVTVELKESDAKLSGQVELWGSDGQRFTQGDLKVKVKGARVLSFVVPPDVAPGQALLRVLHTGKDQGGRYLVPFFISRLALSLDAQGTLEVLPLPPSALSPLTLTMGQGVGVSRLSLSPGGGMLGVLAGGKVSLMRLGRKPKDLSASLTMAGGRCLRALADGLLVGNATEVKLLKLIAGKGITQKSSFAIPGCVDLAANDAGTRVVVLHRCDADHDGSLDDCITEVQLGQSAQVGNPRKLDGTPSAVAVRLSATGDSGVVADGEAIYGLYFGAGAGAPGTLSVSRLPWGGVAAPVDLARTSGTTLVSGRKVHLYAVADAGGKEVRFVSIDNQRVNWVLLGNRPLRVPLSAAPSHLAFGRRLDLYVLVDGQVLKVNHLQARPTVVSTGLRTTGQSATFAVQP